MHAWTAHAVSARPILQARAASAADRLLDQIVGGGGKIDITHSGGGSSQAPHTTADPDPPGLDQLIFAAGRDYAA